MANTPQVVLAGALYSACAERDRALAEVERLAGLKAQAQIDRDTARDEVEQLRAVVERVEALAESWATAIVEREFEDGAEQSGPRRVLGSLRRAIDGGE